MAACSSFARIFFFFGGGGGRFYDSFPACALKKIADQLLHTNSTSGQDQPTMAQRAEATVAECSLDELRESLFP